MLALAVGPLAFVVAPTNLALKPAKQVQRVNAKVPLFGLQPNMREVFPITGFDRIFGHHDDRAVVIAVVD